MQLVPLALGIGLAFAAGYLQRKQAGKNQDVFQDDSPVNLATRGTFIPLVMGRARVGAVVAWIGNRIVSQEVAQRVGGKGSKKKKVYQTIYYEEGWHQLCVGPVQTLHRVLANGLEIFTGPVTSSSHPSGSRIETSVGGFDIYWGEPDQPINTYLGDLGQNPASMGVQSRWPLICYVVWRNIRLGTSAAWPNLTYEVETRVQTTGLTRSAAIVSAPGLGAGTIFNIVDTYNVGGGGGDQRYLVADYHADELPANAFILLAGNSGAADGTYVIGASENIIVGNVAYTSIGLLGLLGQSPSPSWPVSGDGTLELVTSVDGLNPAHAIYQMLFGGFPYGMGFSPDDFDIASLENVGVLSQNEGFRSSFTLYDGQDFLTLTSAILQDLGVVLPFDVNSGLFKFQIIRPPTTAVPLFPENMLVHFPEFEVNHRPLAVNKVMFTYRDQDRRFREMTVSLDDDGEALLLDQQRATKVSIAAALDYPTAARIAERRSQEELANNSVITLTMDRSARKLIPGRIFEVEGITDQLIVLTTQVDTETGEVVIQAIPNHYASQEVTATVGTTGGGGQVVGALLAGPDLILNFFEVPALVLAGEPTTVLVTRVRGGTTVIGAQIHISRDNVTYQYEADQDLALPGGALTTPMPAAAPHLIEIGPSFTVKGPDIGSALDLTGDDVNWRAGRQKCLIGDELMFVRNVEALGGDTYRLRGVIRARYDTVLESHLVGAGVALFQDTDLEPIQDVLLEPGFPLYLKSQPISTTTFALDALDPIVKTLKGKGVVPMDPVNIRCGGNNNFRRPAQGVLIEWSHRSGVTPGTGAGLQSAGAAVGTSAIEGDFTLEVTHPGGGAAYLTISGITTNSYFLSTSVLDAALPSPTSSFRVRVKNVNGGFESATISTSTIEYIP